MESVGIRSKSRLSPRDLSVHIATRDMMENASSSQGRVLGATNKDTSYDSAHTVVIEGRKMWCRLFRTLELRPGMGLHIAADVVEDV